jgi:dihydrofolate synthase/folylpolyglutamate synthase
VASLPRPRGASAAQLEDALRRAAVAAPVHAYSNPTDAFIAARETAGDDDRIAVFGSFLTVGEIAAHLETTRRRSSIDG